MKELRIYHDAPNDPHTAPQRTIRETSHFMDGQLIQRRRIEVSWTPGNPLITFTQGITSAKEIQYKKGSFFASPPPGFDVEYPVDALIKILVTNRDAVRFDETETRR